MFVPFSDLALHIYSFACSTFYPSPVITVVVNAIAHTKFCETCWQMIKTDSGVEKPSEFAVSTRSDSGLVWILPFEAVVGP